LCHDLGAHKWVDFRESKDVVADVIAASDGLGVEGAVVAAGDVSYNLTQEVSIFFNTTTPTFSGKAIQPSVDVPSLQSHFGLRGDAWWNSPVACPTDAFNCPSTFLMNLHASTSAHMS